jgi:hypothetical protein
MLIIRDKQLQALGRAALVPWLVERIQECFPEECEALGNDHVREQISYALGRATTYGITAPDLLTQYVGMTFALGRDFDKSPDHLWAGTILNDKALDAEKRMSRLCEAALIYFRVAEASGTEG